MPPFSYGAQRVGVELRGSETDESFTDVSGQPSGGAQWLKANYERYYESALGLYSQRAERLPRGPNRLRDTRGLSALEQPPHHGWGVLLEQPPHHRWGVLLEGAAVEASNALTCLGGGALTPHSGGIGLSSSGSGVCAPCPSHLQPGSVYRQKPGGTADCSAQFMEERAERLMQRRRQEQLEEMIVDINRRYGAQQEEDYASELDDAIGRVRDRLGADTRRLAQEWVNWRWQRTLQEYDELGREDDAALALAASPSSAYDPSGRYDAPPHAAPAAATYPPTTQSSPGLTPAPGAAAGVSCMSLYAMQTSRSAHLAVMHSHLPPGFGELKRREADDDRRQQQEEEAMVSEARAVRGAGDCEEEEESDGADSELGGDEREEAELRIARRLAGTEWPPLLGAGFAATPHPCLAALAQLAAARAVDGAPLAAHRCLLGTAAAAGVLPKDLPPKPQPKPKPKQAPPPPTPAPAPVPEPVAAPAAAAADPAPAAAAAEPPAAPAGDEASAVAAPAAAAGEEALLPLRASDLADDTPQ
eukprot:gene48059-24198_t